MIMDEVVDSSSPVSWEDISGQSVNDSTVFFHLNSLICFTLMLQIFMKILFEINFI